MTEIRLERPIEYVGTTYDRLSMREPTSQEISSVRRKHFTKYLRGLHLTANVCGVPAGVLKKLCDVDAERIGAEMNSYLDAM